LAVVFEAVPDESARKVRVDRFEAYSDDDPRPPRRIFDFLADSSDAASIFFC
jgi:hypothetical protein